MSASVCCRTPSKNLPRWLISSIDMPTPGMLTEIALRLFEDGQREHGRAGREIEDAWCGRHELVSRPR